MEVLVVIMSAEQTFDRHLEHKIKFIIDMARKAAQISNTMVSDMKNSLQYFSIAVKQLKKKFPFAR